MDERKAFEAKAQEFGLPVDRGGSVPDGYLQPETQLCWQAWQAATAAERERAAKVCEEAWPEMHKYWGPGQARAACEDCAAAIRNG